MNNVKYSIDLSNASSIGLEGRQWWAGKGHREIRQENLECKNLVKEQDCTTTMELMPWLSTLAIRVTTMSDK